MTRKLKPHEKNISYFFAILNVLLELFDKIDADVTFIVEVNITPLTKF